MQRKKIDPVQAWNDLVDLVEGGDFLDLNELERMFALSPEELQAEFAAHGFGPDGLPMVEGEKDART